MEIENLIENITALLDQHDSIHYPFGQHSEEELKVLSHHFSIHLEDLTGIPLVDEDENEIGELEPQNGLQVFFTKKEV